MNIAPMKSIYIVLLFLAVSCKSQQRVATSPNTDLKLVVSDYYYGGQEESIEIIREEGTLKKFFMKLNQTRKPGLPMPDVDFTINIVILYTGNNSEIDSLPQLALLEEKETQLLVSSKTIKEQKHSNAAASGRSFQIYTLPITDKEVVLVKEKE